LIARTDAEGSNRITSAIDPVDRAFILGRTKMQNKTLRQHLSSTELRGADLSAAEEAWEATSGLMSLDEAVKAQCGTAYETWAEKTIGLNATEALDIARTMELQLSWDADGCRTSRGWYRYRGGIDAAISRSLSFADYADMVWSCAPGYDRESIVKYEKALHAARPGKWLGYNWSFGMFKGEMIAIRVLR
jgi:isocitrate lyase